MRTLAFDIEADGLNEVIINKKKEPVSEGKEIFCMVIIDVENPHLTYRFHGDLLSHGVEMLRNADLIMGHNIAMYDIPMLERFYGPIDTPFYDTLIVSRMMYPDRMDHPLGGNSLECWGKHLGIPKLEFMDFSAFSKEMLIYCERDVVVTTKIYQAQKEFVKQYTKSIKLEHMLSRIIAKQISNGFGFDLDSADQLERDLLMEKVEIEDNLCQIFPLIVEERWSDKTGKRLKDKVTHFNPASRQQIAMRLGEKYGWEPSKTKKGNPKVDSAELKKLPWEEAKILVHYFDIIKLLGMVEDWISRATSSRDGRIHGNVNTQGTVTGRMTASQPNLQQVSGDKRARSLFTPKHGWKQVGIDASGLEARLLANRMAPWDEGEFGRVVLHEDIHTVNQQKAGLPTRDSSKTFFYALIYGAGNEKIGKIIGKGSHAGKIIKERYLEEMPALKKLLEKCKFQVAKKGTLTLLDGREVPCRSAHKALNVQIQGDGAMIMKVAQTIFSRMLKPYNGRCNFMATVHDEWQLECEPEIAEDVGQLGVQAIQEAGKRLGCVVDMDGEYRIGNNWADCH